MDITHHEQRTGRASGHGGPEHDPGETMTSASTTPEHRPFPPLPAPDGTGAATGWVLMEVAEAGQRLRHQMSEVWTTQGLTRREVLATQRQIRRLDRQGLAPPANAFWEVGAQPRARRLGDLARAVIDEEMTRLVGTIRHRRRQLSPMSPAPGTSHASPAPVSRTTAIEGRLRSGDLVVTELMAAACAGDTIDALGQWWQRRLRWAAVGRALPLIAVHTPSELELVVTNEVMRLLDRAPWCHGDRLLSAFELTQRELRAHTERWLRSLDRALVV
jgi:hypothetical protein